MNTTDYHRMGLAHHRAKLSDHDVELIRSLLNERQALIDRLRADGASRGAVNAAVLGAGISYRLIATKFEVSKIYVRLLAAGERRLYAGALVE